MSLNINTERNTNTTQASEARGVFRDLQCLPHRKRALRTLTGQAKNIASICFEAQSPLTF